MIAAYLQNGGWKLGHSQITLKTYYHLFVIQDKSQKRNGLELDKMLVMFASGDEVAYVHIPKEKGGGN